MMSKQTFRFVGNTKASMGRWVRICKVFRRDQRRFMEAPKTSTRTRFTMIAVCMLPWNRAKVPSKVLIKTIDWALHVRIILTAIWLQWRYQLRNGEVHVWKVVVWVS